MRDFRTDVVMPLVAIVIVIAVLFSPLVGLLFYCRYESGSAKAEYLKRQHSHVVTWQEAAEIRIVFDANNGKVEVSE